jgi:hypothetical protein
MSKLKSLLSPIGSWTPLIKTIAVVVVIALLVLGFSQIRGCSSKQADAEFIEGEAEIRQQLDQARTERDQAIGRADASEKREEDLRVERAAWLAADAAVGNRIVQEVERMKADDKKFEAQMAEVDVDVDYHTRICRICERARRQFPGRKPPAYCSECPQ